MAAASAHLAPTKLVPLLPSWTKLSPSKARTISAAAAARVSLGPRAELRVLRPKTSPHLADTWSAGYRSSVVREGRPRVVRASLSSNAESVTLSKNETELSNTLKEGSDEESPDWKIRMLFDGDCPLCLREVNMLKERNKEYKTIKFVDISDPNYNAEENNGIDFETAMGRIHAIERDGTVLTNIQAFKKLYENVGLGWVYSFTQYPLLAKFADRVYDFWAKYRLPITGRPSLQIVLENRRKQMEISECDLDGRCKTDS